MTRFLCNKPSKGRTIRKVMGGGGKAKIKIEQGKRKEKKIRAPKKFDKKKFVQRLFNRENYKLTGHIRGRGRGDNLPHLSGMLNKDYIRGVPLEK